MTILGVSKRTVALYSEDFLQTLEQAVRLRECAQSTEERARLGQSILLLAKQLVLLERFLKNGDGDHLAENLQKACKVLVSSESIAQGNFSDGSETKTGEKIPLLSKPLIYFYRQFYRMINKTYSYSPLLH